MAVSAFVFEVAGRTERGCPDEPDELNGGVDALLARAWATGASGDRTALLLRWRT